MITQNIKNFNKKTLSKIINLLYVCDSSQQNVYKTQILSKEFHNFFGERKGRLKVKKRRWLNKRAHLRKETPEEALYNTSSNKIFENYLNLPQNNEFYRLNRISFIHKINSEIRNIKDYKENPFNIIRLIIKLKKMVRLLSKKYKADKRNIIALFMSNYAQKILIKVKRFNKKLQKNDKFNLEN